MKRLIAVSIAALMWGCSSDPVTPDSAKPGVEERSPGATTGKPGPSVTPVKPGPDVGSKPVPPKPVATTSPLKDPNNILSKRSVFYEYDSDAIKDEFRPLVQAHARYLADNPNARALVQGNTDERGSREYNIALGQRRADALKRMMTLLGARENQIETVSLGEEKPRCNDSSESCYGQNRRSDILHSGEF
jgi:peptidoglycan-associated lipoprotein